MWLGLDTGREFINSASDVMDMYTPIAFLQYLVGAVPAFTYDTFSIGCNTNHWVHFFIEGRAVSDFQFFGFVTIGTYPVRTFDPGAKTYQPYTSSVPFGLGSSASSNPYLVFSYLPEKPGDPGPFVFLT